MTYNVIPVHINPAIVDLLKPRYPRWEKRLIKRKYGKYPALYLDVYVFREKLLYDLIPRTVLKEGIR